MPQFCFNNVAVSDIFKVKLNQNIVCHTFGIELKTLLYYLVVENQKKLSCLGILFIDPDCDVRLYFASPHQNLHSHQNQKINKRLKICKVMVC